MNKGIVMEMSDKAIIVMTADGRFERIARKGRQCQIGEEIVFAETKINWKSPSVAAKSALAAAVVFCLVLFGSFAGKLGTPDVVAYVSMDINPSVEMGIDQNENVVELRALNADGQELIQSVEYKGKPIEDVTEKLLDKAEEKSLARGEGEIVIASTVVAENAKLSDAIIAQKLKQQVVSHIKTAHPDRAADYQVTAFAAPPEIRETASKNDLSMGKYAVYLNAKSNGVPVTIDEVKRESVLQLAKQNGVEKVIGTDTPPSKTAMKQLLEEEKSGQLDKKVEEAKKERDKAKNDPKKPVTGGSNSNNNNGKNDGKPGTQGNGSVKPGTPAGQTNGKPAAPTTPRTGSDNAKKDDNKKDDTKKDDKKENDNKKEDPRKDDPKKDDPKRDDPRKDDPKKDNAKKDDEDEKKPADKKPVPHTPADNDKKKDDPKKDDKKDDPKKDNSKKDDPKKDDNKKDDKNDSRQDGDKKRD